MTIISPIASIAATPLGSSPNVAIAIERDLGLASQSESSLANLTVIRRRTSSFSMKGNLGDVLDGHSIAEAGRDDLLDFPNQQKKRARVCRRSAGPAHDGEPPPVDLALALHAEHFGDVKAAQERLALDRHSFGRLQEEFSDHRPIVPAGHAGTPPIEFCLIPQVMQQRAKRELRAIVLDRALVALQA